MTLRKLPSPARSPLGAFPALAGTKDSSKPTEALRKEI